VPIYIVFYLSRQRHRCHAFQYFEHLVEMEKDPDHEARNADPDPSKGYRNRSEGIWIHYTATA
jgi:hypothetical protein